MRERSKLCEEVRGGRIERGRRVEGGRLMEAEDDER